MNKKFNDTLEFLGSDYSIKTIDLEKCIYRKIGRYEIEISGLNVPGTYDISVYIWQDEKHMIKSIHSIQSKEELLTHLETLLQEFERHQD